MRLPGGWSLKGARRAEITQAGSGGGPWDLAIDSRGFQWDSSAPPERSAHGSEARRPGSASP
jgi:hypothetical protein